MTADACFLLLALAGPVAIVDHSPAVRTLLFAIGALLVFYFAYGAIWDARSFDADAGMNPADSRGGFRKAFALAITNPFQIAFWLTIGVGLLESGHLDVLAPLPVVGGELAGVAIVQTGHPTLLVGLFGGILVWITGFPAAIVAMGRRIDRAAPAVTWLSAAVLAGSGVLFVVEVLARLPTGST